MMHGPDNRPFFHCHAGLDPASYFGRDMILMAVAESCRVAKNGIFVPNVHATGM